MKNAENLSVEQETPKNYDLSPLTPVGWREWVGIPAWGVDYIKAKVDTGARTSSIHAEEIESLHKDGKPWVRFTIHPWQGEMGDEGIRVEAPVVSWRSVRSSSGHEEMRPVVTADLVVADVAFSTEITLTNRDEMGFRMLLGRRALNHRFVVIPGKSYLGGIPPKAVRMKNRGRG
ncbi:MAG: RimK/LysX family protein [Spirochaetaceae bacterium]|nr:RimK/LysX family protein [Spirochaetaceae bacterium]MDT8297122.1 RimK/LysX family protein [Spirochaetaceae bacterium]